MQLEELLSAGGFTMVLIAAMGNLNAGLCPGVNYRIGATVFFPFMWFAYWLHQKIGTAKQLLTAAKKHKGKENVTQRADISQGI